ncbi:MAG: aminopeptidase N [Pseudomonadota bacterium]
MRTEQPPTIRLRDYTPPPYLVDTVHLTFQLAPDATRVTARVRFRPNPDVPRQDLYLDGEALELIRTEVDGTALDLKPGAEGLTVPVSDLPEGAFDWVCETRIDPASNTVLEGLYMSRGMYCTQCEAEGFRRITYFPDRPDVMATYTVRIEGEAPVLLSNGNLFGEGPGWAEWHDPWPKPCYLFALVAGDLTAYEDSFRTLSGRDVTLKIFVRPGDEGKCAYAMDALKRSMRWDEEEYGREYDLDLFMIVAVDDFNAGAMENKGLNIFNAKYVLASPETATDRDYEFIEGIIAHEYFHNWTGNRITCRDWFQLCLKEGLTVFRDQQFSSNQRGHAIKRIDDVLALRARQFREDAGPLAHPVRPEEYIEINNFYTSTVYEKGAEVIGMLREVVGPAAYSQALDLYFERHDGQACTIEQWIKVFEDSTGQDLSQFALWYSQAGTPRITVEEEWDGTALTVTLRQSIPDTPGQTDKKPMVIPLATGVLWADGREALPTRTLVLTQPEQSFRLDLPPGGSGRPAASVNRGFSAPVVLEQTTNNARRAFLLAHDTDPFTKWDAGRMYLRDMIGRMVLDPDLMPEPALLDALVAVLDDSRLDPAFQALAISLPSIEDVFQDLVGQGVPADPMTVFDARERFDGAFAAAIPDLQERFDRLASQGPYTPDAKSAGRRGLRGRILGLITRLDVQAQLAQHIFDQADNMTVSMQALSLLVSAGRADAALKTFYDRWQDDANVLDKWFGVQAAGTPPDHAPEVVAGLTSHRDFDWKTPNRFRAVIGSFAAGNKAGFHRADGAGYTLLADWLLRLDAVNPATAARLAGVFETWRQYDAGRQAQMRTQMQRLADRTGLSKDMGEIIGRMLAG